LLVSPKLTITTLLHVGLLEFVAVIFLVVAFVTMAIWAKQKHRNYKKEFGKDYPRERAAIVPFVY